MKLVTTGCSLTKDNYQLTWPDYLSQRLGSELINIASRGSGIDFLSKRLVLHCLKEKPDLVVIMLPSIDRFDWYVDQQHPYKDTDIGIASWQDGKSPSFVKLDGTLSNEEGYILSGGQVRGNKKYWYKYYYSETIALINYWHAVYTLENFFKTQNIKYFFTMAYDKNHLVEQEVNVTGYSDEYKSFFDVVDWKNFIFYSNEKGFLSFVKDKKFDITKNHPVTEAHESWVDTVLLKNL